MFRVVKYNSETFLVMTEDIRVYEANLLGGCSTFINKHHRDHCNATKFLSFMCVFNGVAAVTRNYYQPLFKTASCHLPYQVTEPLTPVGQV